MAIEMLLAAAAAVQTYTFTDASQVTYTLVHPAHTVVGKANTLSGSVSVSGQSIVTPFKVTLGVEGFDSGNRNRDANALETLKAVRYPRAVLNVTKVDLDWKTFKPAAVGGRLDFKGTATGTLTLRGVTKPLSFPIEGWAMPADARVMAKFPVSLADFGIPAHSLMFVPTQDRVDVDVEAVARRAP